MNKILDRTALLVSIISSPLIVVSLAALLVIRQYSISIYDFYLWAGLFIGVIVLLPTFFILLAIKRGVISDFHIAIRQERFKPFLFALLCTLLIAALFYYGQAPKAVTAITAVMLTNGVLFFLITLYWKISIHLASLSGSIIITSMLINPDFLYLYVAVPAVIWARIRRHRHSIWQGLFATVIASLITAAVLELYIVG